MFTSAKYHLLAAARSRLVGDVKLPGNKEARAALCQTILDIVWDEQQIGTFTDGLTSILLAARDAEQPGATTFDGALVRSNDFAERIRLLASDEHAKG